MLRPLPRAAFARRSSRRRRAPAAPRGPAWQSAPSLLIERAAQMGKWAPRRHERTSRVAVTRPALNGPLASRRIRLRGRGRSGLPAWGFSRVRHTRHASRALLFGLVGFVGGSCSGVLAVLISSLAHLARSGYFHRISQYFQLKKYDLCGCCEAGEGYEDASGNALPLCMETQLDPPGLI